jgi:uncharacterized repeat protein (TIGR01451 family)
MVTALAACSPALQAAITATKDDGVPQGTRKNPGDTVTYTNVITNGDGVPMTGVTFTDPDDSNAPTDPSSVNATAVAVDDIYPVTVLPNVGINTATSTGFNVLTNDFLGISAGNAVTASSLTLTCDTTSANGGTVSMVLSGANVGTFSYTPAPGFTGTDTFSYVLNSASGTVPNKTATVTLTVSGPVIWFVNNNVGSAGDGRFNSPFNTLAALNAVNDGGTNHPKINQFIFLYESATAYTGPVTLLNGQQLLGQDSTASLGTMASATPPADSGSFPAVNSGNGTIVKITSSSNAVVLNGVNGSNQVRGLTIGNTTNSGISGTSFGTLTLADLSITDTGTRTGQALNLSGGTINSSTIANLVASSAANGISLTNVNGSLTVSAGSLSTLSGADILISGGACSLSFPGAITNTAGRSVDIQGHTGGTIALSGAITDTGTGIFLNNNGGTAINFTGGLTSNTGANPAFTATGGGTVTLTGSNNTIGATTPLTTTAVNIANTTIGVGGVTFRRVSTNGGTNGIVLNTVGSGGFTITGDGNTSVGGNSSGGTIQNTTGHGISLTSVTGVSLTNMNIQSTGGSGIDGVGVVNFTFANGTINNSGNAVYESNISFTNAGASTGNNFSGVLSITNSTLTNAFYSGIDLGNESGTISNATITGNTITSTTSTATSKGYGISLVGIGNVSAAANLTKATVSSNTIRNFPSGGGIQVSYGNATAGPGGTCGTPNDSNNIVAITNNVARGETSANRMGTHAITVSISGANSGSRSVGNFDISNNGSVGNAIGDNVGHTLLVGCNGYATMTGTVNNNVIVSNNTLASNGISGGNGIVLSSAETPDLTLTANGNTISQTDGNGILLVGRGTSGTAKLKIQNNNVVAPLTGVRPGIRVDAGNGSSVDDAVFLNISGNTSGGSGGVAGIGVRKQGTVSTTNDFAIQGLTSSPANPTQVEDYLSLQNPGSALGNAATGTKRAIVHSGDNFLTTNSVPLLFAEGGVEAAVAKTDEPKVDAPVVSESHVAPVAPKTVVEAEPQIVEPVRTASLEEEVLTDVQLQTTVEAAIERWRRSGLSDGQTALLRGMRFELSELPGMRLGEAGNGLIRVDSKAGGQGWYVDLTPLDDGEFSGSATRMYTQPTTAAAGRMDLLTALLHEMGHALGLDDSYLAADRENLMYGYLTKGERRLPAMDQARDIQPHDHDHGHFLTAPISIGTLPAGKSITITSTVTISSSISVGQISSQGTINATVSASPVTILTNDPNTGTADDPTITLIGIPPAFTSTDATTFQAGQAGNFSVTTSGIPTAAITNTGAALPSGVTLTDNSDGTASLAGTPAAGTGGVYNLTFTANNTVAPNATQSFTLTVNEAPFFTSSASTNFVAGSAGTFTVTTSSYPANAALSITSGSLPTGVTFTDNGDGTATLAGTTEATAGGTYPVTISATNGISPAGSQNFVLTVNQAPAITSANAVAFTEGVADSFTVTTTGFPTGASMAISSSGSLPGGVTFTDNGDGTATLAGTPAFGSANAYPLTLTANNGVSPQATQNFTLTVKPPVHHFTVSAPASATAGTPVNVTVTAYDSSNAVVTGYTGTIHFTSTDVQAELPADYTFTAGDNGVRVFSVTLKTAGSATVSVADTVVVPTASGTSDTISVTAGAASQLTFLQQPTNAVSQTAIAPEVTVQIQDAFGNLTASTVNVTLAIGTNPGGGTLSGTPTAAAVAGVATFSNLSIDKAGTGYTLAASSDSLTGATSSTFDITAGTATQLAFSQQPGNTVAGAVISPAVTVSILDAAGNLTSSTANVTLAIGTNPNSGTLSGTPTVAAVDGVATFSNLSIDKAGTGYTLAASSDSLTGATSSAFDITAAAPAKLAFLQQPGNTVAGVAISPAMTVQILDAFDNLTSSTANVTLAIGSNPNSGTLSGTPTVAAVAGVATFSDLSIDKAGTGYTLAASSDSLTGATSSTFDITAAAPSKLAFLPQPGNTVAGVAISPAMTVQILDAFDNLTSSTANVTLAIGTNPNSGTLSGTPTVAAVDGVATFSDLSIDKAGAGYTLAASSDSLTGATSSTFDITAAAPAKLAFLQQPSNTVAGVAISPAVTVQILDEFDNPTSSTAEVILEIDTNPGSGTLSGTTEVNAVSGVATFSNLSIDKAGTGYTLSAYSPSDLIGTTSSTFDIIAAAPAKLAVLQQPSNTVAGVAVSPAMTVQILDAFDNLTSSTADVTLAIDTNPGGGTLLGTPTVAAVAGVATFSDISIDKVGTDYTLVASSDSLTGSTSSTFNITPAAATHFAVSAPANAVAGTSFNFTVTALDAFENTATGYSGTVHFTSSDAPATLPADGTLTSGVGTFAATLKTAGNQTLTATDTVTASITGTSGNVLVVAGEANQLAFSGSPSNAVAGTAIGNVVVQIQDAFGNLTTSTADVSVAIGTNPGSGTLSGTPTVAAVAGVATFSNVSIDKVGTGYMLAASSNSLTGSTSSTFNITPAAATHFAVSAPANAVAGTSFNFTVTALDAFENTATGYSGTVHFTSSDAPATLPADGTLTSGVGTFAATLKTAGNQTLTATDTVTASITGTSAAILVDPRSDLAVTIGDSPDPVTAGTNLTYTIQLTNNGPSAATNVSLNDTLPAGTTFVSLISPGGWSATTPAVGANGTVTITKAAVAPAENATFTLVVNVAAAVTNGSIISDTVTASTTTTELSSADNSATATTTVSTDADLSIAMTDTPDPANAGTNISYALTVTNNGPSDAANVSVSDVLPAGTTYVSSVAQAGWSTTAPAVGANGTVTFGVAALPAGGTAQFTIVAKVDASVAAATVVSNTSTATASTSDSTPGNNSATTTTTISRSSDLAITMTDSPDPVNATQNVTYTIDVVQNGPSDASGVSVSDTLPANTTFVSANAPAGWSATTPAVGGTGTITFTKSAMSTGESAQFTIVANVDLLAPNDSTLTNTAIVSAVETDPAPGNNSATTTTLVKSGADLVVSGSASVPVVAGTNVTYSYTVENLGPLDADNAVVSLPLPAGTTFVSASSSVGWSGVTPAVGANGTVSFGKAVFANGDSATFTVVALVSSSVPNNTVLSATVTAASDTLDLFPLNSSATIQSTVTTQADLAVTLGATPDPVIATADVTYTIGVSNVGPSDATNVSVSLPLPATMTFVSASGSGWTATTPAVGSGGTVTFTNTALANGASTNLTVVAKVVAGTPNGTVITATTTISGDDTDPTPGNNVASASVSVGTVDPTPVQIGTTATLKPQTGLYELSVDVTNTTPLPINGFRLHVDFSAYLSAFPSLRLYNASSPANSPDVYVDYPYPVMVDGTVTVKLLFYTSTRTFPSPFAPVLTVEKLDSSQVPDTNGNGVHPTIKMLPNGKVLLEFPSVGGHWYRVRYSPDMVNWFDCPVPIQAGGSKVQWIDDGAPFTNVPPASVNSRFYIVNEIDTP